MQQDLWWKFCFEPLSVWATADSSAASIGAGGAGASVQSEEPFKSQWRKLRKSGKEELQKQKHSTCFSMIKQHFADLNQGSFMASLHKNISQGVC